MSILNIPVINQSANPLPEYASEGSSGMDLRANLPAPLVLKPLQRVLVPTGLFIEIPAGFEAQVRPRSGLALKQGITCLNTPGTIDSDYRGEIKIILINLSDEDQVIEPGERIAQLVVSSVSRVLWQPVENIGSTLRSGNGFGHTGKH